MSEQTPDKSLFLYDESGKLLLSNPESESYLPTADLRDHFEQVSMAAPPDPEFEQVFLSSKISLLESHPGLSSDQRAAIAEELPSIAKPSAAPRKTEWTGAVGYGAFYDSRFRKGFNTGTALAIDFIAPTKPGGNVSTWLYLTATNRTAKGVEALVRYKGQEDLRFNVFDWARPEGERWQVSIDFNHLLDYLTTTSFQGETYQILSIQNQTKLKSGSTWENNVWLLNYTHCRYDLVYSYQYESSEEEQKEGWHGSWGPITETFQEEYKDTNKIGFLKTRLRSRDSSKRWKTWSLLTPKESKFRNDGVGFQLVFLRPNHSFAVH